MAHLLSISGKLQDSGLKGRLDRHLAHFAGERVEVAIHEFRLGEWTQYTCALDERSETYLAHGLDEVFRSSVAQAIAETIVRDFVPAIVVNEVRGLKPEYDDSDIESVLSIAERGITRFSSDEALFEVAERVLECLWERESLDVEGFIRFRLRAFRKRLRSCVKDAVRRFESSREQQEFVKLLRHLVNYQDSSIEELHVYPDSGNSFEMRDQNGSSVDSEYLETYVWDLATEGGVDREDLLISAVVSLAPGKVHWHLDRSAWKSPMLEKILEGRLVYCTGCDRCAPAVH